MAEKTSQKLNISENYEEFFKKLALYAMLTNMIFINTLVFNNLALGHFPNFNVYRWTLYYFPRLVSFNTITLFIWCLIIVRQKFRRLNEEIQLLMQNDYVRSGEVQNEMLSGSTDPELIRTSSCKRILPSDRINIISELHCNLRDVIRRIQGYFALLILFNITMQLLSLTLNSYIVYRFIKGHSPLRGIDFVYLSAIVYWVILPLVMLTLIGNVCGSTSDEANKTGNILHAMLNRFDNFVDPREAVKFHVFALDLLQHRVRITVFGFLDLDYFIIYRTIATAITYLVIMLQFYS